MTQASVITDANGAYSMDVPAGKYRVAIRPKYGDLLYPGDINVNGNSPDGDLNSFLITPEDNELSSEALIAFQSLAVQAKQSAEIAKKCSDESSNIVRNEINQLTHKYADSSGANLIGYGKTTVKEALDNLANRSVGVTSVNGKSGDLNLTASDLGAITREGADNLYLSLGRSPNLIAIYPGGTPEIPAIIGRSQRIVVPNPYGGCPVIVQAQVYINNIWGCTGYGGEYFVQAAQICAPLWGDIVVQSGSAGVAGPANKSGASHTNISTYESALYRLLVWRVTIE